MRQAWPLDAAAYVPHRLHSGERIWPESNCSVDLWIELLHACGAEPLAALPFTLAVDLQADQWTFFKFPLADLSALYGVDVIELNVWRTLTDHLVEEIALGRVVIVEVDAFYLPDTAATSYQREHVKTSIGVQAIDVSRRWIAYFHNAGYYALAGDDFDGLFRLDAANTLPPYSELALVGPAATLTECALRDGSIDRLRAHVAKRPRVNPFRRYAARFPADLEWLSTQPPGAFHRYAFATLRQCGSAFDLAHQYLRWLERLGERHIDTAASACLEIAMTAQTLQFKTARAATLHRPLDAAPLFDTMASAWDHAMERLHAEYGE
jgi:hypothetical protein